MRERTVVRRNPRRAVLGPWHLLLVAEAFARHLIRSRFHKASADPLAVAVPLAGAPELWVVAGPPEHDVYAIANRIFYRDVAVLALLALFTVGVSLVTTDLSVLRDLRLLEAATHRFGRGDLTVRAPVPRLQGEIRELAIAFAEAIVQVEGLSRS